MKASIRDSDSLNGLPCARGLVCARCALYYDIRSYSSNLPRRRAAGPSTDGAKIKLSPAFGCGCLHKRYKYTAVASTRLAPVQISSLLSSPPPSASFPSSSSRFPTAPARGSSHSRPSQTSGSPSAPFQRVCSHEFPINVSPHHDFPTPNFHHTLLQHTFRVVPRPIHLNDHTTSPNSCHARRSRRRRDRANRRRGSGRVR